MIETFEQLIHHSWGSLDSFPSELREEMMERRSLEMKGCSEEDIARLTAELPGMPETYLEVLRLLSIKRKGLMGFEFSPGPPQLSLVDQLIRFNNKYRDGIVGRDSGYYLIGSRHGDLLALREGTADDAGGEVAFLVCQKKAVVRFLAHSFRDFLMICASIEEVAQDRDVEKYRRQLDEIYRHFDVTRAGELWDYFVRE